MKTKILILFAILILTTIVIGTIQAESIYNYGNYSVNNNVTISACISVNSDKIYANITKPDNTTKIASLSCGGKNYCQPSWIYCIGIFRDTNVSGVYNVSFYSDKYEFSDSFIGYFTVFEGTFLNVTFPLNNSLTNNRTIIIKGLTNGTYISIKKDGYNFTAIVVNETFSFPLNLTEGENVVTITAYGKYRHPKSIALHVILDTAVKMENNTFKAQREEKTIAETTAVSKNETKFIKNSLKIRDDENNTIGVVTFEIPENKFFNASCLRFVNKTIFYESKNGEGELFNATAEIGFWGGNTGKWEKGKIRFEVNNGKIEKNVSEILERVSMERKKEHKMNENAEIIEPPNQERNVNLQENVKKRKLNESEVRDEKGNLTKNGIAKITLPNGEKIKVKTDEKGKVKLTLKNGKIENVTVVDLTENLEEGKLYELEVKDEDGKLIKNEKRLISLPNGQVLEVQTDKNGRVKLLYSGGYFSVINDKIMNDKNQIEPKWYYFLPLLLIPVILFYLLQENKVVADIEFLQKAKANGAWNRVINKFKIYVLPETFRIVTSWKVDMKNIESVEAEDEIKLAERLNIKKILTESSDRVKIAESKGFEVFDLNKIMTVVTKK